MAADIREWLPIRCASRHSHWPLLFWGCLMNILEFAKDALLALTDAQLQQLIGRLAEAEVAAHGGSVADVRFSGSITAPDGGVDIRVDVKKIPFESGFIPRPNTVFQSKKHRMPVGAITSEMVTKSALSEVVNHQAELGGHTSSLAWPTTVPSPG